VVVEFTKNDGDDDCEAFDRAIIKSKFDGYERPKGKPEADRGRAAINSGTIVASSTTSDHWPITKVKPVIRTRWNINMQALHY